MEIRKSPTEKAIRAWIARDDWGLPPLEIDVEILPRSSASGLDTTLTIAWGGRTWRFGAVIERLWTPKAIEGAVDRIRRTIPDPLLPLIIVPYLAEKRLRDLEQSGISGIDLSGNGIVIAPGELFVFRSGSRNCFRQEGRIKNVYRGTSAIITRALLLKPEYPSVGAVLDAIRGLGGETTLSTVSKVCRELEDDLIIDRGPGETPQSRRLRLLQPEKLLDRLRENYVPPAIVRIFEGKYSGSAASLEERFMEGGKTANRKLVRTGFGSVGAYAVMARESVEEFYCTDLEGLRRGFGDEWTETTRFPTIRILETTDEAVYFDRRPQLVASPVQTWLELATGDKREKETADQVRRLILRQLADGGNAT